MDGLFSREWVAMPGKAEEAAREGWRLRHSERQECREEGDCQEAAVAGGSQSRFPGPEKLPDLKNPEDARELLPAPSNETCRGFCPGFFCLLQAAMYPIVRITPEALMVVLP